MHMTEGMPQFYPSIRQMLFYGPALSSGIDRDKAIFQTEIDDKKSCTRFPLYQDKVTRACGIGQP